MKLLDCAWKSCAGVESITAVLEAAQGQLLPEWSGHTCLDKLGYTAVIAVHECRRI